MEFNSFSQKLALWIFIVIYLTFLDCVLGVPNDDYYSDLYFFDLCILKAGRPIFSFWKNHTRVMVLVLLPAIYVAFMASVIGLTTFLGRCKP